MSKVSVIVPVYNKERYLPACLDSLLHQSLKDIEILCIDDKSEDGSAEILRQYAAKDSRIRAFYMEANRGVSAVRNFGMREAAGEFIGFVDADDFVAEDFYEKLYADSEGYDCVKGEIWDYEEDATRSCRNNTYDLNDKIKRTGNPIFFFFGFTSAIYRKSLIDRYQLHFPEKLSYYEDPFFSITLATRLTSLKITDGAVYYYRKVEDSLSRCITPGKMEDFCRCLSALFAYLKAGDLPKESKYIAAGRLIFDAGNYYVAGLLSEQSLQRLGEEALTVLEKSAAEKGTKISVIVPVYNGEKYLRRTLLGLLLQTLYEIEIICVNDCSSDRSLEIIREYQRQDGRIRIIDCAENGGESKARNIGIHAATGEYIAFMDQDDSLDANFYEKLYERAVETKADIVKGDACEVDYDGNKTEGRTQQCEKQPLYFSGEWWTAIFSRELLLRERIELPEGYPLGGDLKFLFDACISCNRLSMVRGVNYYHLMHFDSGDSLETSLPKIKSVLAIFTYILNRVEEADLYEKDRKCYIYYYASYIYHANERIARCPDTESKRLCCDFIFRTYQSCRCGQEVLDKLRISNSMLSSLLENNQKDFYEQLLTQTVLSGVFWEKNGENQAKLPVDATVLVPYINREPLERFILQNTFLKKERNITFHLVDNRAENRAISRVYNEFLEHYDYTKESWLIFMHSDFEFLTFPSAVLENLDSSKIYGPVGAKLYQDKGKMFVVGKGRVYEKTPDNTLYPGLFYHYRDRSVDTLDCMCLIVHSSLVQRYCLRFDENTEFDLYGEEFCIHASREYGIAVEALEFDCAHHSAYAKEKYISRRYLKQLQYMNRKYPNEVYGGTVTAIGGKVLPKMSEDEFRMYKIRQELLTGKKL